MNKIFNWKNWNWKNYILFLIASIIIILIIHGLVFNLFPTRATVESFLKENSCNPSITKTEQNSEYECAYYLRRHTSLTFGKIYNVPNIPPLFVKNPFGYFSYDLTPIEFGCALTNSCKNDEHVYVFVITKDEGALVYNPINGNFIGSYDDLMLEMGCKLQPEKKAYFYTTKKFDLDMKNSLCYTDRLMEN